MRKSVVAGLAALLVASLAPVGLAADTAPPGPGAVTWGKCPSGTPLGPLECGTLPVPLDYRDPRGGTIDLAISRLASANPAKRRGVLLLSSGGPGAPAMNYPLVLTYFGLPQSVRDSYDLIGMDPRGVGYSTPVTCDLPPETSQTANIPDYALDSADVAARAERVAEVARKCGAASTAGLLPHLTTANTARDMDRVREALGERKLSFLGVSYGTYLGAAYATMFPQRGDRIVLDSSMSEEGSAPSASRGFGQGVEDRFPDLAKFIVAHPEYGLGTTEEQVKLKYYELAARLDAQPRPDGFDGRQFRRATFERMYTDQGLPQAAELWRAIETGQPVPPLPSAPPPPDQPADNVTAAQLAVLCGDRNWPEPVEFYQRNVEEDRFRFPMWGAGAANIWPCAFWPVEPVEPPVEIGDRGPSNVLMVQNLRDPSTPLSGALRMREALGDRARMITADQGGHGAYLYLKNQCLNDATTDFLVTGERPREDLAC
ncbi:alpha/beta hydrolase [Amycolatopsis albispora]|uniref:Hydrolase n=1 Tax=Amycolatopsis albispora TaxID=1804986 RepID=A0A344LII4_9PSEU|nr:alpha/beta hydrolase [Amycolatopsis albispora]AXB47858.1 hydrolase [Amycolatopsis albispora]